jgi:lambda family phage tail tape measure protein
VSVVANVAINVDSRNAVSKLRQVQQGAQQTERAFGGLASAVGKLAVAFAGIQAIKFVFAKTAELESQARSLAILAGSAEKAGQIIKELQQLGAVTPFTSTELIDSAKRLQAFGVEANKVVETTRRLADVSGATGAELSGLVTAYGQVQAKGRLQGEELLQFQERGVALQTELRKMYGLSGEEFQKALEKGRIGSEAVEVAIKRLTDAGGKYANGAIAQSDTLNGKLSTLQDSFEQLARNIGTFFAPVFKFLIDGINAFLDRVNNGLRVSAQLKANEQAATRTRSRFGVLRQINPFDKEAQDYEARLQKSIFKSLTSQGGAGAAPSAPGSSAVPALLGATANGGRRTGGGANAANRAAEAAVKLEQQTQERLRSLTRETELIGQITNLKELQAAADAAGDKELQARLAGEEQIVNIIQRTAQELDGITDKRLQQAILGKAETEISQVQVGTALELQRIEDEREKNYQGILENAKLELALAKEKDPLKRAEMQIEAQLVSEQIKKLNLTEEQINQIRQLLFETEKLKNATVENNQLFTDMASATAGAFGSAIDSMLDGTESLSVSLRKIGADLLKTIAKMLLMQAIAQALGALGGNDGVGVFSTLAKAFGYKENANGNAFGANGIIPFAKGGIVNSPTLFPFAKGTGLMGEAGPEAIMPLQRGANGKLGVLASGGGGDINVVVNVDASGSSVEGNEQEGQQLGRVIAAAIQAEMIKQKRPGGLLA